MLQQLTLFGVPDVQESTCQVPVSDHSIFNALEAREVTPAEGLIYLKVNELSNWETGQSHALSYNRLSKEKEKGIIYIIPNLPKKVKCNVNPAPPSFAIY